MHNAILEADQKHAKEIYQGSDELTLSAFDIHAELELELSRELRDLIECQLTEVLLDRQDTTVNTYVKDAARTGYEGLTTSSLWKIHDQIQELPQKDMDLLMDMAWGMSVPRLARVLEFDKCGI